jgi:hypothetical protein
MKKGLLALGFLVIMVLFFKSVHTQESTENKTEKKEEVAPLETSDKARKLLDEVLKLHAIFNMKMTAPEFADFISGKLNRWRQTKNLKIPEYTSWNKMKFDLDQLGSQLALLQNDARYIDALRKNHDAYKGIQQLKQSLQKIYQLPPKLKSISFIPLLNAYAQQLYTNKLLEKINTIMKIEMKEETKETSPFSYSSFDETYIPEPMEDFSYDTDFSDYSFDSDEDFGSDLGGDFDFDFDFDF